MPKQKPQSSVAHAHAGFDTVHYLSMLCKKALNALENSTVHMMEPEYGYPDAVLEREKLGTLNRIITRNMLRDGSVAACDSVAVGDLAFLQANRVHQALIDDFGLPLGLAAPEVIVLDLCPETFYASNDAIQVACGELAASGGDISPENAAGMLENKFWAVGNEDITRPKPVQADFSAIFQNRIEFLKETERIFDSRYPLIMGDSAERRLRSGNLGVPVLVVLALFPKFRNMSEENEQFGGRNSMPIPKKPFTRHDESMRIFTFVEELLSACGQGIASVTAPAELCNVPEAVGMRKRWVRDFNRVYVDAMAESALYQLQKLPPARVPRYRRGEGAEVRYKRDARAPHTDILVGSLSMPLKNVDDSYQIASPGALNKYSLIPQRVSEEYASWASVADIPAVEPTNGLMEKRGGALIDIDDDALARRMRAYFDHQLSWRDYAALDMGLTEPHSGFKPEEARESLLRQTRFTVENIKRYAFKPFDSRFCYYDPVAPLWNDPRIELARQCRRDNRFLVTRPAAAIGSEGVPFFFTDCLTDGDLLRGHGYCIPFRLYGGNGDSGARPNLSSGMLDYLRALRRVESDEYGRADLIWLHVLAIGFSPAYLAANAEALRQGWPRIPFPMPDNDGAGALLLHSAGLGEKIAALLEPRNKPTSFFKSTDADSTALIAPLSSWNSGESFKCNPIALNTNWGYAKARRKSGEGEHGSAKEQDGEPKRNVMPGNGRMFRRTYSNKERRALEDLGLGMGLHAGAVYAALGHEACDIYLNQDVHWRNVPSNVWEYRIGGYPVLKKWLSYREHAILGRDLWREEIRYFTEMAQRLTALRLLESELDRNFASIRDSGGDPTKQG